MPVKGGKPTEKQLEALFSNQKRLKKGEQRTKEIGSMGGKKSGEVRQERAQVRTFASILAEELSIICPTTNEPRKNGVAKKLVEAIEKATPKEAAKLFEVLRDTLGEAPAKKIDINASVKSIGNWREALTTEEETDSNGNTAETAEELATLDTESETD